MNFKDKNITEKQRMTYLFYNSALSSSLTDCAHTMIDDRLVYLNDYKTGATPYFMPFHILKDSKAQKLIG